jgi:hypothetical protein
MQGGGIEVTDEPRAQQGDLVLLHSVLLLVKFLLGCYVSDRAVTAPMDPACT